MSGIFLRKLAKKLKISDHFGDVFPHSSVNPKQSGKEREGVVGQQMFDSGFQQLSLHTDFILNTTICSGYTRSIFLSLSSSSWLSPLSLHSLPLPVSLILCSVDL